MIVSSESEAEDLDPYYTIYSNIFYQGISNSLPWHTLIFAYDYFEVRLKQVPEAKNFLLHFVLIFMTMRFIFLVSGISVTARVRPDQQVIWSIIAIVVVFMSIGIIGVVEFTAMKAYYYALLALVLLAALFGAFIETGFLAILAYFPPKYMQAYLVGHGFGGVVTALLHMCSAIGTASTISRNFAKLYFGFATIVVFISLLLFHHMKGLNMFQYHFQRRQSIVHATREADKLEAETGMCASHSLGSMSVLKNILDLFLTIFLVTWLNVLISPMLILMTESTETKTAESSSSGGSFFHVFALLLNSIFDLIGKCLPAMFSLAVTKLPFLVIALLRLIFLPLLLLGNIRLEDYKLPFKPLYASDTIFLSLVAIKAFSGGYLGTLCMMWLPLRTKQLERSKAITLMVYSLGTGLLLGATTAYFLKQLLVVISTKT